MKSFPFSSSPAAVCQSLALLAFSGAAFSCDSCGCHAPPELGEASSGLSLGLFSQYTDFSTLKEDGTKIDNPTGQYIHSTTVQAIIGYRFNDRFAISAFVPYISRSYKRPNNGEMETGTEAGLGDASVLGKVDVVRSRSAESAFTLTLLGGIKAPTGDPSQLKSERDGGGDEDPDNAVGGHDLALGSGSWDGFGGLNAVWRIEDWFITGHGFYTYHTQGAYQYQIANEISGTGGIGYLFWSAPTQQLSVQANAIVESKGADTVQGEETTDTTNHNVFLGPEVDLRLQGTTALLAVDLPVHEQNSEVQLVPTWRVRCALGYQW